ncbi:hypothetical protein DFJ73DRAFT_36157 [Zopfochytrium polystomum]|nr:hypothetical protein DFJ73DRAFT_36157 [Zopfochytrium polystomum]
MLGGLFTPDRVPALAAALALFAAVASPTAAQLTCHDVCVAGDPLDPTCSDIAACVIAGDSYCGSTAWDSACVSEASSLCGANCDNQVPTTDGYSSSYGGYPTPTYSNPVPNCHDPCVPGGPMGAQCGDVAKCVGQMDSYCQSANWDSICVSEANQCGASCSGQNYPTYGTDGNTPTYTPYTYSSYSYPVYSGVPSPTPSVAISCHDECTIGDPMDSTCSDIAGCVSLSDAYCQTTKWDSICVAEAKKCGAVCSITSTPTTTTVPPTYSPYSPVYSSATSTDSGGCHDVCLLGGPLTADCGDVASCVIGQTASCGTDAWDANCITLANQCGASCSVPTSTDTPTSTLITNTCHDVCTIGAGMDETCGTDAACVVAANSACYTSWDTTCVATAVSSCSVTCPTPSNTPPNKICHDPCTVGDGLPARCGTEIACVLTTNPECETGGWTSACIGVLQNSCGFNCTASTWTAPCVPRTAFFLTSATVSTTATTVPTTTTSTTPTTVILTATKPTKTTTTSTSTTQSTKTVVSVTTKPSTTVATSTVLATSVVVSKSLSSVPKFTAISTASTTTTTVSATTTTTLLTSTSYAGAVKTTTVKTTVSTVSTSLQVVTAKPPPVVTVTVSKKAGKN